MVVLDVGGGVLLPDSAGGGVELCVGAGVELLEPPLPVKLMLAVPVAPVLGSVPSCAWMTQLDLVQSLEPKFAFTVSDVLNCLRW